MKLLRLI